MRTRRILWAVVSVFGVAGCGNDADDNKDMVVVPDLVVVPIPDMATAPLSATAQLRVAMLSPDTSAIDVCIAPTGTTGFGSPLLAQNGLPGGISYGNVSRYITVQLGAGQVDVRVVAGGSGSCATALITDMTAVAVTAASTLTLAAIGQTMAGAAHPLALSRYLDDTAPSSTQALFRFVQAAPQLGAEDVSTGTNGTFQTLFTAVPFGSAGMGTGVDANGYLTTAPFATGTLLGVSAGTSTLKAAAVAASGVLADPPGVPAAGIRTVFEIGGNTNAPIQPLQALLCGDNLGPSLSNPALSNCIATNLTP